MTPKMRENLMKLDRRTDNLGRKKLLLASRGDIIVTHGICGGDVGTISRGYLAGEVGIILEGSISYAPKADR
jgi:hypothetical protein